MLLLFGSQGGLAVSLSEGVRVGDPLTTTSSLTVTLTEGVRVGEALQRGFAGDLIVSLTESVKARDAGQNAVQLRGAIRVRDGPIVASLGAVGGPLTVTLAETLRVRDADNSWAELTFPEGVRVTDTIAALRLEYGTTLALELLRVRDTIQAERVGAGAPAEGLTHAISIARHGRTRFHLVRLPFVISAWALGQLIDTRVRSLVFDRNHGTWEGPGTVTRGLPMQTIPEGELGAGFDGNVWVRVPNDGDGFVVPGDAAGRTMSLVGGDADIIALIVSTRNDSVLRPIVQKQNTNSTGSGWHLALQNGQLKGYGKTGTTLLFAVSCAYPITDGAEHWVQLHVDTVAGFAHLIIDGVNLAQEHFTGEFGLTAADLLIGAFHDLQAGAGFIGTIALVGLARQGDPTICATLNQARVWDDITVDVRVERAPVSAEHGRRDPAPLQRIAGPGALHCILDNSHLNAAGLEGRYTPGHANSLPGFEEGIPIKWEVTDAATGLTHVFFHGEIAEIDVEPGTAKEHQVEVTGETWLARAMRWRCGPVPIQLAIRSDEAVRYIVDQAPRPPRAVSFAVGDATFPVTFDLLDARTPIYAELGRLALNEGGLIYEHPDGTLVFESQTQRYLTLTPAAVWTQYDLEALDAKRAASAVINSMPTTITPVEIGASATDVLATMTNRLQVLPGASVVVELTYRDEAQPDAQVGGMDLVTPVAFTDYTMTDTEDGGGDLTGFAVVAAPAATQGGRSVKLTFTNTHPTFPGYVQTQIRGRALKRFNAQTFPFQHDESIFERDVREKPLTLDYQTNAEQAESFVRGILALRRAPFMAPRTATRRAVDAATQVDLLTRRIGDVVGLQEPVTALTGTERTFIEGLQRQFGREVILVGTYSLDRGPAAQSFMVLDEVGYAELDDTAVLA